MHYLARSFVSYVLVCNTYTFKNDLLFACIIIYVMHREKNVFSYLIFVCVLLSHWYTEKRAFHWILDTIYLSFHSNNTYIQKLYHIHRRKKKLLNLLFLLRNESVNKKGSEIRQKKKHTHNWKPRIWLNSLKWKWCENCDYFFVISLYQMHFIRNNIVI